MRGLMNSLVLSMFVMVTISSCSSSSIPSTVRHRRGLELSSVHHLIGDARLQSGITPIAYNLTLHPVMEEARFNGSVQITLNVTVVRTTIELHSHYDMIVKMPDVEVRHSKTDKILKVVRAGRAPKKTIYVIRLEEPLLANEQYMLKIAFNGVIWDTAEGLFKGSYPDSNGEKKHYLATHMRPNNARRLFPCFDEPEFKTPFTVAIARPKTHRTLFNTALKSTKEIDPHSKYVIDHFETTERMSTFTFGFVISQLTELVVTSSSTKTPASDEQPLIRPSVRIWARPEFHPELAMIHSKVEQILRSVRRYWNVDYPLSKLDVVALPGFTALKPIDNWGLVVFKESDLSNNGYYLLAQELIYQWFGAWISPKWWSDAHINKAVVGLLAAQTSLEIDNGQEFDGKWPMTQLYSIYYEFSKRYPHSRITGLKQETTCTKTELVLRMLNYTIGERTFRDGLRQLFDQQSQSEAGGLFYGENVWNVLSQKAHQDGKLPPHISVNEIVNSWITKDRLPVVTLVRDYEAGTAVASQKVYLRERPHDVPEQDKMLWWIPLVVVRQDRPDFGNATPQVWLQRTRDVQLPSMPTADQFVIVNPEEIGPFPVNYDARNWNLLAQFLQTEDGRKQIPIYTRAKLLHDAWNLAYAGDLSFATAFNMTLFMKYEREHLVWNPVFTLIDHIGNHIDMSTVHKKFETYVRILLTPLYEELGPVAVENEEKWKDNLRSLARLFLCRAGYKPCIEEAQTAYGRWMESDNPDEGNPVPNQYICPVFKWGTQEEWEFGLQRVINFPATRKQSERTYLLKCLVGCPMQTAKIERLLNITILEENRNFTESDIFLEFNMLSSGSSGYINLFNFLSNNWAAIRERFADRTNLWDNLISSATGVFTTQEGYDMVSQLYQQRQGEFGSAEHIVEKSLRNIKEETKWSAENLPVIEQWLDVYLSTAETADKKFLG